MNPSRAVHVVAAGAVAVATLGLLSSWRGAPPLRHVARAEPAASRLPLAPTYAAERERHHDNRLRHPGNLRAMSARPSPDEPTPTVPDAQWEAALAARMQRRAYDGAPPTIPHPVRQQDFPNCLTCHGEGMRVAAQVAPAICHETHSSCVQCHVPSNGPVPGAPPSGVIPFEDNAFAGLQPPTRGERAWAGAPPTIPHATTMRQRCDSCHGPLALGLRTSHPWRQSCTQCHAPSAALDQRPALAQVSP
ncbi:MAG: hypothetical protein U0324_40570 [Polyangiales bacterium]